MIFTKDKLKIPFWAYIIFVILIVGVFLRTYNFHDWMRFSMDQSRDAFIISDALDGKASLPSLGPVAGGTDFHLGPAYYYFSYISALIFGNYPDKMAYPSLISSILAIGLLYLFARLYFNEKISLIITGVMSLSLYFVESSRFSSNPNLIPFFILLYMYALMRLMTKPKNKLIWLILIGLAVGVSIQLHTTLLVILPFFTLLYFIFLNKDFRLKERVCHLLIVVGLVFFLNIPQFIHETRTGWINTISFFTGFLENEQRSGSIGNNVMTAIVCQMKSNAHIAFYLPVQRECSDRIDLNLKKGSKELFPDIKDRFWRKSVYLADLAVLIAFSVGGYMLFLFGLGREKDDKKKKFLRLVFWFNLVSLIFLIPIISVISVSYFNIIFFVPLVIFGIWIKTIEKLKYGKIVAIIILLAVFLHLSLNIREKAIYYQKGLDNDLENSNLSWAENAAGFFIQGGNSQDVVYVSGEKKYMSRFLGPISYLAYREGVVIQEVDASEIDESIPESREYFYIKNSEDDDSETIIRGDVVQSKWHLPPVDIYLLNN